MNTNDDFVNMAIESHAIYLRMCLSTISKYTDTELKVDAETVPKRVEEWYSLTTKPLVGVRYVKAVERLTKKAPVVYHALMYKDLNAVKDIVEETWKYGKDLMSCFDSMSDKDKTCVLRCFETMTRSAYEAHFVSDLPFVPTRQEIQENIRNKKERTTSHEDSPSISKAFYTHLNSLTEKTGAKCPITAGDEDALKQAMASWHTFGKGSTNCTKNSILISKCDESVLPSLNDAFPELGIRAPVEDETWKDMQQLANFSAVTESIPTNMMSRIEAMANRLADDIVSGKTDMANVNLGEIGQQVLSGCNESDMSNFASNIEDLLPALQNFGQGLKSA